MAEYLGETPVLQQNTPFADFTPTDWALYYVDQYGWIDGGHHKMWVLDQVARILTGSPVEIRLAKWDDGTEEYRVKTSEVTEEYTERFGNDWDAGIAP